MSILCTTPGQYEAIVAEAKRQIKLPDLGIQKGLKFKRAIIGALTLEIPRPDSVKNADCPFSLPPGMMSRSFAHAK